MFFISISDKCGVNPIKARTKVAVCVLKFGRKTSFTFWKRTGKWLNQFFVCLTWLSVGWVLCVLYEGVLYSLSSSLYVRVYVVRASFICFYCLGFLTAMLFLPPYRASVGLLRFIVFIVSWEIIGNITTIMLNAWGMYTVSVALLRMELHVIQYEGCELNCRAWCVCEPEHPGQNWKIVCVNFPEIRSKTKQACQAI